MGDRSRIRAIMVNCVPKHTIVLQVHGCAIIFRVIGWSRRPKANAAQTLENHQSVLDSSHDRAIARDPFPTLQRPFPRGVEIFAQDRRLLVCAGAVAYNVVWTACALSPLFRKNKVMHPALYAGLSALVSTAVFRIEKGARLNVLQSYTEKVVLIALLRKFVFLECENDFEDKSVEDEDNNKSKPKNNLCIKEYFTSICIGAVAVMNN